MFIIAMLVPSLACLPMLGLTSANPIGYTYVPTITINADGNVSPNTNTITKNGNVYTLTEDIQECALLILCSKLVLDGAGHTINITKGDNHAVIARDVT